MRATEMVPGEAYALRAGNEIMRATVIKTTATNANHVWVRMDEGLMAGAEFEVPSVRILQPWRQHRATSVTLVPTEAFDAVLWLPDVGCEVECDDTGSLRWTVESIDVKADEVVISSTLFSRPMQRTLSLANVHPIEAVDDDVEVLVAGVEIEEDRAEPEPEAASNEMRGEEAVGLVPTAKPEVQPRVVARRLAFGPTACQQYRQLESRCRPGDEAKRMRREIRRRGDIRRLKPWHPRHQPGEYIRYRVPRLFEVVLFESPSKIEGDIHVDRIEVLRRRPQSKR